jgi:phage baseplate assembly protein V
MMHALRIELNGGPLSAEMANLVAECRIQHHLSRPSLCEVVIERSPDGREWPLRIDPGDLFQVRLHGTDEPLFSGEVTACQRIYQADRGQAIRFRGYDLLHRLRKRDRFEVHADTTLEDLARRLVSEVAPEMRVDPGDSSSYLRRVIQAGESDYAFLVHHLEARGLYLAVWNEVVHLTSLEGVGGAETLRWGESLWEAAIEWNEDGLCRKVRREGWTLSRIESYQASAEQPRESEPARNRMDPGRFEASGDRILASAGYADQSQVLGGVQAELDCRAAAARHFWGMAEPNPKLRPGARIDVGGVDEELAGLYVLTSVTHRFDPERGLLTELDTRPPRRDTIAQPLQCLFGVVSEVDDPEGFGRVKVVLDHVGGLESDWMQVVVPGAGDEKGILALPDIDDHVLILCPGGNPAQGVVVGGLYGTRTPPDAGVSKGRIERYTIRTRGGQSVVLDDVEERLRLENRGGSYWEAAPDRVTLHAAADLVVEAPGRRITIRGDRIDFEQVKE